MIFDYLRSCYSIPARIYADSDETVTLRWCKAQPGAKVYPFPHAFGSHVWDDSTTMGPLQGVGEYTAPQNWSPNRLSPFPGTCLPDDTAALLYGLQSNDTTTPATLCCNTLADVACGELAFAGVDTPHVLDQVAGELAFAGTFDVYRSYVPKGGALVFCGCGTLIPAKMIWLDPFGEATPVNLPPHFPLIGSAYTADVGTFFAEGLTMAPVTDIDGDTVTFDDGEILFRYDYDVLIDSLDPTNNATMSFLFRWADTANYWVVDLAPWVPSLTLSKVVAGVKTVVDTYAPAVLANNTYHVGVSEDNFGQIGVSLNWSNRLNFTDGFNLGVTRKGFRLTVGGTSASTWVSYLVGQKVFAP